MLWEIADDPGTICAEPALVALDLGELELHADIVAQGIVPRFDDPFTTYRVGACTVTVYASNADGAMLRGGELHEPLRDWIASRYGVHRYSDAQWKR
jgi:hypothetical protein